MNCPKCGHPLKEYDVYCSVCGELAPYDDHDLATDETTQLPDISKALNNADQGEKQQSKKKKNKEKHQRVIRKIDITHLDEENLEFTEERVIRRADNDAPEAGQLFEDNNNEQTVKISLETQQQLDEDLRSEGVEPEQYNEPDSLTKQLDDKSMEDSEEDQDLYELDEDEEEKEPNKKHTGVIVTCTIVGVAILAIVGFFLFTWLRNGKMDRFVEKHSDYWNTMQEYEFNYGEYRSLYDTGTDVINRRDYSSIDELTKQMDEFIKIMVDRGTHQQALGDIKEQYSALLDKLQVTEEYQATYDDIMARLDQAIADTNEEASADFEKELESLRINLTTANQQLVQTAMNEINVMNLNNVTDAEKSLFESYRNQVNSAVEEGNYAEALRLIALWKDSADEALANLKVQESIERERLESESRELESATAVPTTNGYILEGSESRVVTEEEVGALTLWQRTLARCEIYARHGRMFEDENVQVYFNGQPWYQGTVPAEEFDDVVLNETEKQNIAFIQSME